MPVPGMEPPPVAVVGGQSNSFGAGISKDVIRGIISLVKPLKQEKRELIRRVRLDMPGVYTWETFRGTRKVMKLRISLIR